MNRDMLFNTHKVESQDSLEYQASYTHAEQLPYALHGLSTCLYATKTQGPIQTVQLGRAFGSTHEVVQGHCNEFHLTIKKNIQDIVK